ncbi:hypothetical protein Lesp02_15800 [Lentzea sp. NBRC 105346]|uniref:hypothetical protein n=1 Tax=Lentzea sp. NBRC 105346 TaxID=3032205 RepID=UPI0024A3F808|nr:hypothetical protein [Lentzea sp. NBRC 105346]GLZ29390.1 hypothetical protein Lesp02_15800 [Lentzea sp. NBRC 105346]
MTFEWVSLILGVLFIFALVALFWRIAKKGTSGRAKVAIVDLFELDVELTSEDREQAAESIEQVAAERGKPAGIEEVKREIEGIQSVKPVRVLWVDDFPDNNVREVIALEHLGCFVTAATSTRSAERYLDNIDFSVVITDLGRAGNPQAGVELAASVRQRSPNIAVIAYTFDAEANKHLVADGFAIVADAPAELISAILKRRDR